MAKMSQDSRGFHAVAAILLVIVVAVIGFTAYAVFASGSGDPAFKADAPAPSPVQKTAGTAAELVAQTKKTLADHITINEVAASTDLANPKPVPEPQDAGTANVATGKDGAYYKASGGDFYAAAEKGASLTISLHGENEGAADGKIIARVHAGIIEALTAAGLKPVNGSAYTNQFVTTYKSDDIVCQTDPKESTTNPRTLRCSDVTDIQATIEKLEPIAAAHAKARPDEAKTDRLLIITVLKDSATSGYKYAKISHSTAGLPDGSSGYYYQKAGSDWQFFVQTQMNRPCAEYDANPDAKAAFKGEICNREGQDSTVQ